MMKKWLSELGSDDIAVLTIVLCVFLPLTLGIAYITYGLIPGVPLLVATGIWGLREWAKQGDKQ